MKKNIKPKIKKNSLTYRIVYLILLTGMILHLVISHPFAEGWIICSANNNTHLENANLNEDCHTQGNGKFLVFSSNCDNDFILEHQEEYYSNNKVSEKKILPVSEIIFLPEIENKILSSHYNSINLTEIEPLSLTIKDTANLLI